MGKRHKRDVSGLLRSALRLSLGQRGTGVETVLGTKTNRRYDYSWDEEERALRLSLGQKGTGVMTVLGTKRNGCYDCPWDKKERVL